MGPRHEPAYAEHGPNLGLVAHCGTELEPIARPAARSWTRSNRREAERVEERIKRIATGACVLATITALLFAGVELGAFIGLRRSSAEPASRAQHVYERHAWAETFWREFEASKKYVYQPYVVWRRASFAGETIVVDESGLRLTDGSRCDDETYTIYMFGGSTMWGTGVPNWATIPSFLARRYQQAGRAVCVKNYGESAWVSTQEVVKLMLELKRGGRTPDLVVFYDGASGSFGYLWATNTFQFLQQAAGRAGSTRPVAMNVPAVAQATITSYLQNIDLVDALSQRYGFAYTFFWQPVLFGGQKPLTQEEERLTSDSRWRGVRPLTEATYELARGQDRRHLYYVADAFREYRETLYVDFAHVQPDGNRLIAERMYEVLRHLGR